ncbi:hypothetical protein, conserved [Plasmodium gonderi]|uniref:Uncharacterized protein n=1 Tax=Plasmodium gonderi TaxID=77519 RepID=A0A1Y1JSS9_PLAGO|nr:hypothetical protein, conserved [Plasmodium gonderi]GAW83004.1 hypothetical protein, conserved [Plasmodium gonderi]
MMLNTTILQSYIHKSYDKVSNAFIKTSKSLLRTTNNNIGYPDWANGAGKMHEKNTKNREVSGGNSDEENKIKSTRALLRNYMDELASRDEMKKKNLPTVGKAPSPASETVDQPTHQSEDYPSRQNAKKKFDEKKIDEKKIDEKQFDENTFFANNFDVLNKILREDNKRVEENKERTLKRYKKLLDNNDTLKMYKEINELHDERILLIKFINYHMNMNSKYETELQKIQTSYEILLTENEQLIQNNIILKKHIDLLQVNGTSSQG